jgi:ribonuclease BN (tRNA processing enzyme)
MELTVLGCSGSYGAPPSGTCSGYLVRHGATAVWVDCGNGTLANLQRHLPVEDLTGVVITHHHPDHSVDLYGLHVMWKYALERSGLPVLAPPGVRKRMTALVDDWGDAFEWIEVDDGDTTSLGGVGLRFSRTAHPVHTVAVELSADGKRVVYTSDTCADWSPAEFGPGADLILSEASYQRGGPHPSGLHLDAHEAGHLARAAEARQLMITHIWPLLDPAVSLCQSTEAFGAPVLLAKPHLSVQV